MNPSSPLGALTFSGAGRSLRCVPGPSQCAKASGVWKIWKIWKTRWTKKNTIPWFPKGLGHWRLGVKIWGIKATSASVGFLGRFTRRYPTIYWVFCHAKQGAITTNHHPNMKNIYLVGGIPTPPKKMNQLGWLFPIWKKNVPSHQPDTARLPSIWSSIFPCKSRQIAR